MLIHVADVGVRLGDRTVLSAISFEVGAGEMTAVVGPSGSGKSTLLGAIAGEVDVTSGAISRHVELDQIALVVQSAPLLTRRTALDNVQLAALVGGRPEEETAEASIAVLRELGLDAYADTPVRVLSGGERQRLGVARAIVARPAVILADEPTASLDAESRDRMFAVLTAAASSGAAVVIATHDLFVSERCAAIIRLDAA